ncbi:MAG: SDR family oxidoreductase [Kordiimonadaceae bacterium]|jgi:2-keto-3-deoxy-L-fuconate dehydrogenase|nr:SDR family oxidoreductase [Kordiimonadaceae bacterium]MBT6031854.1 SDR family oxidoreductase [Kordiimonadaceae bacterium]
MKNKIAVVTAAGQGIGRAVAEGLVKQGANVYALDINPDTLKDVVGMTPYVIDCTEEDALKEFFATLPHVDILVHGVGYVHHGTIEDCDPKEWRNSMNITLDSTYFVLRETVTKMKDKGGSIVNIASICSSIKGFPNRAAYGAAKGGVIGLTKSIAIDYLSNNIRCNAVCPGTTQTPSLDERIEELGKTLGDVETARQAFIDRQPMGRLGTPEEIASMIIYLASDESSYVTGQTFNIDGGTMI